MLPFRPLVKDLKISGEMVLIDNLMLKDTKDLDDDPELLEMDNVVSGQPPELGQGL
jgi:hypothetical protein